MNEISAMNDVRWKQRFQNFEKAFLLLQEIVESKDNLSEFAAIVQERGLYNDSSILLNLRGRRLKTRWKLMG